MPTQWQTRKPQALVSVHKHQRNNQGGEAGGRGDWDGEHM